MSNFSYEEKQPGQLLMTGELTIYDAAELKDLLLGCLHANPGLEIDLSGVTELDSSGVQVMLLVQREANAAEKTIKWLRHSPVVSQVLDVLNLGSTLGEPVSLVWS
ncbi:MAG: hypothetical protein H6R19_2937 [Proteobacteria bacterium]|nr:hypothetical protein [Pseudomonadota bacterium]